MGSFWDFAFSAALILTALLFIGACTPQTDTPQPNLLHALTEVTSKNITGTVSNMTDENLVPFPTGWVSDNPWGTDMPGLNVERDLAVTHNGEYTLRIDPLQAYSTNTGFDYWIIPVSPGDYIRWGVWIKTDGIVPVTYAGARHGLDFIDASQHRISAANCLNDAVSGDYRTSTAAQIDADYVHWGTDWIYKEWLFYVPNTVVADQASEYYDLNEPGVPAYIIPWCQIWIAAGQVYPQDAESAWFSEPVFNVNPSATPPTSVPVAVAVLSMMRTR